MGRSRLGAAATLIFVALDLRMAIALALSFVAGRLGNVRAEPGAVRGADLKAVR